MTPSEYEYHCITNGLRITGSLYPFWVDKQAFLHYYFTPSLHNPEVTMSSQPDFSKLLTIRNIVSRQTRQRFIDILTRMDQYEEVVDSSDDFIEAIRILRADGFEDRIDEAGAGLTNDLITGVKYRTAKSLERDSRVLHEWFDRVAAQNRVLALHGIMLIEHASIAHTPIRDGVLTDPTWDPTERHPSTNWATFCKYLGITTSRMTQEERARFRNRSDEAYRFLRRFSSTHLLPGTNAEEYIRANDSLVYDKQPNAFFEAVSSVVRWSIVTPEEGVSTDFVTFDLATPSRYHFQANYSLTTRTLSIFSPLYSLRAGFRVYAVEDLYDFLLETAEELIRSAILDGALVFGTPGPEKAMDGEIVPRGDPLENLTEDIPEETFASDEGAEHKDEEANHEPATRERRETFYVRSLTYRKAVNAFVRLGALVFRSHHTMISHKGKTVRFSNPHQIDTHILRMQAQKACRALGIPWADFVEALW